MSCSLECVKRWVDSFFVLPSSVILDLSKIFPEICSYGSDKFYLIASPDSASGSFGECSVYPSHFPVMWSSLFVPVSEFDNRWIIDNAKRVSECGFFVFESCYFGSILGIDGSGYDFYEKHWIPLYGILRDT